ncbi:MAG: hypothetical protein DI566_14765, partial [Microbacterium sp.]
MLATINLAVELDGAQVTRHTVSQFVCSRSYRHNHRVSADGHCLAGLFNGASPVEHLKLHPKRCYLITQAVLQWNRQRYRCASEKLVHDYASLATLFSRMALIKPA